MQRRKFIKAGSATLAAGLYLPFGKAMAMSGVSGKIMFNPEPTDEILVNPGIGFETFHCFNGDERDAPLGNYPECSLSYHRYYWNVLEPEEGKYNFELIDELLEKAERYNQDIALRFMPISPGIEHGIPKWYIKKGKGSYFERTGNKGYAPDFNDPYYLDKWEELTGTFGEKYSRHPRIDRMEIGGYGFWSEWNISHTNLVPITEENSFRLVDMHFRYWDSVPLMMLTAFEPALKYALIKGAGWRVDSFGDYGYYSDQWNFMETNYPLRMERVPELREAWKNGPVGYEPPGIMTSLPDHVPSKGGSYENMWNKALEWHGSVYNAKSGNIPDEMVPGINDFLRKCGYRFVVKSVTIPEEVNLKARILSLDIRLENAGVAPTYHDYILALRLQGNGRSEIIRTNSLVKSWLPGEHALEQSVLLPGSLSPGDYRLSLGLLRPSDMKPAVLFANKGNDEDRWLKLEGKPLRLKG